MVEIGGLCLCPWTVRDTSKFLRWSPFAWILRLLRRFSASREVCIVIGHAEIMLMQEPAWKLNFPNRRGADIVIGSCFESIRTIVLNWHRSTIVLLNLHVAMPYLPTGLRRLLAVFSLLVYRQHFPNVSATTREADEISFQRTCGVDSESLLVLLGLLSHISTDGPVLYMSQGTWKWTFQTF